MAKIVDMIDGITGKTEKDLQMKEQFGFLQKMAQAKCEQFRGELQNMFLSGGTKELEIVGNRAMSYHDMQHVNLSSKSSDSIKNAIEMFFKGKEGVIEGFKSIVETALDTLIGNSSMGEYEEKMFFVYPENFAIVRVDVKFYKYTFSSKGIIAETENIFCYTMAKSIVDHKKLSVDELLYLVTEMIGADKISEVKAFIKELRDIWKMLESEDTESILLNYQLADAPQKVLKSSSNNNLPSVSNINELKKFAEGRDWIVKEVLSDKLEIKNYEIEKLFSQEENTKFVLVNDSASNEDYQRWAKMIYKIDEAYGEDIRETNPVIHY
ncbi:hypothetical protein ACIQ6U_20355 [Lysinibacillus fusiformis]|uniref:hypothetical protein n=1 Tax=Lysinibacillus fusiformis TaxID=28031 RepID=UPI00381CC6B0